MLQTSERPVVDGTFVPATKRCIGQGDFPELAELRSFLGIIPCKPVRSPLLVPQLAPRCDEEWPDRTLVGELVEVGSQDSQQPPPPVEDRSIGDVPPARTPQWDVTVLRQAAVCKYVPKPELDGGISMELKDPKQDIHRHEMIYTYVAKPDLDGNTSHKSKESKGSKAGDNKSAGKKDPSKPSKGLLGVRGIGYRKRRAHRRRLARIKKEKLIKSGQHKPKNKLLKKCCNFLCCNKAQDEDGPKKEDKGLLGVRGKGYQERKRKRSQSSSTGGGVKDSTPLQRTTSGSSLPSQGSDSGEEYLPTKDYEKAIISGKGEKMVSVGTNTDPVEFANTGKRTFPLWRRENPGNKESSKRKGNKLTRKMNKRNEQPKSILESPNDSQSSFPRKRRRSSLDEMEGNASERSQWAANHEKRGKGKRQQGKRDPRKVAESHGGTPWMSDDEYDSDEDEFRTSKGKSSVEKRKKGKGKNAVTDKLAPTSSKKGSRVVRMPDKADDTEEDLLSNQSQSASGITSNQRKDHTKRRDTVTPDKEQGKKGNKRKMSLSLSRRKKENRDLVPDARYQEADEVELSSYDYSGSKSYSSDGRSERGERQDKNRAHGKLPPPHGARRGPGGDWKESDEDLKEPDIDQTSSQKTRWKQSASSTDADDERTPLRRQRTSSPSSAKPRESLGKVGKKSQSKMSSLKLCCCYLCILFNCFTCCHRTKYK